MKHIELPDSTTPILPGTFSAESNDVLFELMEIEKYKDDPEFLFLDSLVATIINEHDS